MKFKIFGLEIDCGCDARREKMMKWWNEQSPEFRDKFKNRSVKLFGWIYTFDGNGDVVTEKKA